MENLDEVFGSFFITKSAGEGTALWLCVVQDTASHAVGKVIGRKQT